jgi:hypothetical protein
MMVVGPRLWLFSCLAFAACEGVFVLLEADAPQCFVVEQPLDTLLSVSYEIPSAQEMGATAKHVTVELTDRRTDSVVFSEKVADHKGF